MSQDKGSFPTTGLSRFVGNISPGYFSAGIVNLRLPDDWVKSFCWKPGANLGESRFFPTTGLSRFVGNRLLLPRWSKI